MEKEIFIDIEGYKGIYKISNYGNILSLKKNKFLKQENMKFNYKRITLSKNGKTKRFSVHRLVAYYFVKNDDIENNIVINHIDNNPENNYYKNLEWCTQKHNILHAFKQKRLSTKKAVKSFIDKQNIKLENKMKNIMEDGYKIIYDKKRTYIEFNCKKCNKVTRRRVDSIGKLSFVCKSCSYLLRNVQSPLKIIADEKNMKKVAMLNDDNTIKKEFNSITEAAKYTNCFITSISAVCNGKRKTTKGLKWKFI